MVYSNLIISTFAIAWLPAIKPYLIVALSGNSYSSSKYLVLSERKITYRILASVQINVHRHTSYTLYSPTLNSSLLTHPQSLYRLQTLLIITMASNIEDNQRLWPWLGVYVSYYSLLPIIIGVTIFHRRTDDDSAAKHLEERGYLRNARHLILWKAAIVITALMQGYIAYASLWFPTSSIIRLMQWRIEDNDWLTQSVQP